MYWNISYAPRSCLVRDRVVHEQRDVDDGERGARLRALDPTIGLDLHARVRRNRDRDRQPGDEREVRPRSDGELTRPETRHLVRGQRELRRDERAAEADGMVTARERARLQHEANQQSRRIYRQKHDAQDRR